jgi:AraC-like DNA-binding protein
MEHLKHAVCSFAKASADNTGLARSPIAGLMMKSLDTPTNRFHALYPSMVCLILQGTKRITVGSRTVALGAGQTFLITSSVPATGTIVRASRSHPYVAIAVQIDPAVLAELVAELDAPDGSHLAGNTHCLSVDVVDTFFVECLTRMVRILDHPGAASLLGASMVRELHYWLLLGQNGATLRNLINANSRSGRLECALSILQAEYSSRLSAKRLADAAGMSTTSFHKHFRTLTAMTPGQYQKRVRLLEARRLMLDHGVSVTDAAFQVGYESASQFSRDYSRMFKLPPKREISVAKERLPASVSGLPAR